MFLRVGSTRGQLLALQIQVPTIERIHQGGAPGYVIITLVIAVIIAVAVYRVDFNWDEGSFSGEERRQSNGSNHLGGLLCVS